MGERLDIAVHRYPERGQTTICVAGEIDVGTVRELRRAICHHGAELPRELVVDLQAVTFIGAAALGALAWSACWLRPRGCRLVVAAQARDARLFRICGLGYLLPRSGDRPAIAASRRG
jgi:anti-anti-sigma factor